MSTFSSISSYSHWRFLAKITLFQLLPLFNYFILLVEAPCPFQNPFWFVDKPMVASVFDENGEMVPNKVRVMWNRMENFKCVDYFQVIMFFFFFLVLLVHTVGLKTFKKNFDFCLFGRKLCGFLKLQFFGFWIYCCGVISWQICVFVTKKSKHFQVFV